MTERPPTPQALRAAKLSRIPGITIDEAARRFGVTRVGVIKARKTAPELTLAELALAALTSNGTVMTGPLDGLAAVASWIDHINHDGCTVADVERLLASVPDLLAIEDGVWTLRGSWP